MGIFDAIRGQLIDIIEWTETGPDTMVWRFWRPDNEIMNGAKLVVREGQAAALVSGGQLADVFLPGTHTLATENLPPALAEVLPHVPPPEGAPAWALVCTGHTCLPPITDPEKLLEALER